VFRLHTPPISVVDQPIEEIAERIIDIVLHELTAGSKASTKHEISKITLQPHFIER
jgi:LacI family transcriptional regulator